MGACALLDVALGLLPWPPKGSESAIRDQTLPFQVILVLSLLTVCLHTVKTRAHVFFMGGSEGL